MAWVVGLSHSKEIKYLAAAGYEIVQLSPKQKEVMKSVINITSGLDVDNETDIWALVYVDCDVDQLLAAGWR